MKVPLNQLRQEAQRITLGGWVIIILFSSIALPVLLLLVKVIGQNPTYRDGIIVTRPNGEEPAIEKRWVVEGRPTEDGKATGDAIGPFSGKPGTTQFGEELRKARENLNKATRALEEANNKADKAAQEALKKQKEQADQEFKKAEKAEADRLNAEKAEAEKANKSKTTPKKGKP